MGTKRLLLAAIVVAAVGVSLHTLAKDKGAPLPRAALPLPVLGKFPSLGGTTGWLNSPPLSTAALRGKVVLVDFWTYSCINWRRTLPYLRAWAQKYKAQGLVVIGVHTPEFGFERQIDNVRWAVKDMRVDYPVVLDSEYATWQAFENEYWPALYFIDAQGNIRYHQFGEGEYERSEAVIQQLLAEAGAHAVERGFVSVEGRGIEAAPDWINSRSPENYIGYARTENFSSPEGVLAEQRRVYTLPARLDLNAWALSGAFTMQKESTRSHAAGARLRYRFHARDLHLVMGPVTRGSSLKFRVLVDGVPPGAAHGSDVDESGAGLVVEQRLYQLVRQTKPVDHVFEIEWLDAGVELFSFTFS